ncbi:LacI family DNA-binding transcriptional regulator [Novosphingobium sp.]|uniref:LacI family DNA-binding transcriptional regulator n=1 Tax=Novosphingobium sp. TaxID=1874826 RepID=UPI0027368181|nr:LacI family DNA-binding transcriptional regulator [Novosphingobium sp.]MDP3907337.1 LacI family DNA-binding transcriptional regulator [Novosphingobium sp.]
MSKSTIDDVAALAGVARTTVSRVLNNQPNVRAEVRDKVLHAVAQLGYRVNLQARQLAGKKALRFVLVHASDFDSEPNSYFSSALELGATRAAARLGAQLITHFVNQNDPHAARQILAQAADDHCNGVILTPPFADDPVLLRALAAQDCRVVGIAAGPESQLLVETIGIDEVRAGYDMAAHLLAQGHRAFGFIKGPAQHRSAEGRYDGFLAALAEAGIAGQAVQAERGNFTFRSGLDCAQRLLGPDRTITALVCANDDMAAGALLAAHKAGLRIPQDIAITGFDDTPVSEIVWPPLTTIHQPLRRMGERAVERLAQLAGSGAPDPAVPPLHEIVPHHLVPRDSSGLAAQ